MPKASCRGCRERWIAAIWRIGRIGWALEPNLRTFCDSSTEPNVPGRGVQSPDRATAAATGGKSAGFGQPRYKIRHE